MLQKTYQKTKEKKQQIDMDKKEIQFFKEQSRKDLISFCVYTDKFFEVNKHHVIIAEKLQAFME